MMYSVSLERGLPVSFNASQKLVCVRLLDKTVNLIRRLQRADQSEVLRVLPRFCDDPQANGAAVYSTHVAKQIGSPDVAAFVDPDKWMPAEAWATVSNPGELFREAAPGMSRFGVAESDRSEYVKHTANLLRCGKLRLSGYAHAGGTAFVVGKPKFGSGGLAWNLGVERGTGTSKAAPPSRRHIPDALATSRR